MFCARKVITKKPLKNIGIRVLSTKGANLIVTTKLNGVTTIRLNRPKKLNGWTQAMMKEMISELEAAGKCRETKVTVLTGTDPYYCAGVDLGGSFKPMMPNTLFHTIVRDNQKLFDAFINFPKPIISAVNGPAIGASVTSATLCDAIIASDKATFSTPFARLGITPEGCSSIHFECVMGKTNANKMLGPEGWMPSAVEAKEAGLVSEVFPHDSFMEKVQTLAEDWANSNKQRSYASVDMNEKTREEYLKVNAKESVDLANAFLSEKFLDNQYTFAKEKGKNDIARLFYIIKTLRPLWSALL